MALGGGTFTTMNKVLPGTYINFVSAASASAVLADRGIVTMPLDIDWGPDNEIFTVTKNKFISESMDIFGYAYDAPELKGLRDLFINAQTGYFYKLTSGGAKASNTYATAKYCGKRGNDLKIVITANVDDESKFDVALYMGTSKINSQTVKTAAELADDAWVTYKKDASIALTAGEALTGGTNGSVTGSSHQNYLSLIESYAFNTMGVAITDEAEKKIYAAFIKRLRDTVGAKAQVVLYNCAADYEGVINVKNSVVDTNEASIVYWVTGAEGGCAVNASCSNKIYDGEFSVNANYTQLQLEDCITSGELVLHKVGDTIRVLSDINSLVTETEDKGEVFKANQTVRVCDQIANDIAALFASKYCGQIPNDADGRTSLWADIVKQHAELMNIRAIEGFSDGDVVVSAGNTKKAVVITDKITPVNSMEQIYMTVTVN